MRPFTDQLDTETQLLVAIGSAVAAGCIPCIERLTAMAAEAQIETKKQQAAAIIGQFVKDQPAGDMKKRADALLGTHLSKANGSAPCPFENRPTAERRADSEPAAAAGCGCS